MCYKTSSKKDGIQLKQRFGAEFDGIEHYIPNGVINGFTYPSMPIIKKDSLKMIELGQWGLVPHWNRADLATFRKKTNLLNAMIESVADKPSFRDCVNKRCLVIVDGFYEYKWLDEKGKQKVQHRITVPGEEIFCLGGLYSTYKIGNESIDSFTILTTEANTLMAEIHNSKKRMPVVLHRDEEKMFLDNEPLQNYCNRAEIELLAVPV